jgi:hypothetical protein
MIDGIDSFAATLPDPATGRTLPPADRMEKLLEEVETADRVGPDVLGVASITARNSSMPRRR